MRTGDARMSAMVDSIAGYVTGCPEAAIRNAVVTSAEDYIGDIGGIRFECEGRFEGGVAHIGAPHGGSVYSIDSVTVGGRPLNSGTYSVAVDEDGCAVVSLNFSCVASEFVGTDAAFSGHWVPDADDSEIPDRWWDRNSRALRYAALRMLCSQTGNPWGNEANAMRFGLEYEKCVKDALVARRCGGGQLSCFDPSESFVAGGF